MTVIALGKTPPTGQLRSATRALVQHERSNVRQGLGRQEGRAHEERERRHGTPALALAAIGVCGGVAARAQSVHCFVPAVETTHYSESAQREELTSEQSAYGQVTQELPPPLAGQHPAEHRGSYQNRVQVVRSGVARAWMGIGRRCGRRLIGSSPQVILNTFQLQRS